MALAPDTIELTCDEGPRAGRRAAERRIFIKAPFAYKERCKALPGARWDPETKRWHVPASPAAATTLASAFGQARVSMTAEVQRLMESAHRQLEAQEQKVAVELPDTPTATSAWLHQRRAFHFAKQLDAVMLAMDMGTGKSMVAIALCQEWDARRCLILCPISVVGVWPKQFLAHAVDPDEWTVVAVRAEYTVAGRTQQVVKGTQKAQALGKRLVVVVNYEAAWRPPMETILRENDWDVVIADESHRTKSPGGRTSMFTYNLRKRSRHRICLTGTPMPHSPMDIYAQYRFLDPGIFGTSKNRFQNRYAVMGGFENRQVLEWQNMEELTRKFESIAFVVSKEDALPDLPKALPPIERMFVMDAKQLRVYVEMKEDFVSQVEQGTVVASNSLSRLMRLRQITSGFTKTDEGQIVHLSDKREDLLYDILEDVSDPVVVFCVFHEDLNAIQRVAERLLKSYGELSGRCRDGLTKDSTMAEVDILGCQLKSGGVGIDLTRSYIAIYYSIGYELGDYEQSKARLDRPGQTHPVRYIHLLADGSIDGLIYQALEKRRDIIQVIIDAAKEHTL